MKKKWKKFWAKYKKYVYIGMLGVILGLLGVGFLLENTQLGKKEDGEIEKISYVMFKNYVKEGLVDVVYYDTTEEYMIIALFNEESRGKTLEELEKFEYATKDKRMVRYPSYEEFPKEMLEQGVRVVSLNKDSLLSKGFSLLLSSALPLVMLYYLFMMMKRVAPSMKQSYIVEKSDIKFENVIGHEEILEDLKFVTSFIKNDEIGKKIGIKVPKGILLSGEPGTGKTLIAKAIAGEADVPFLYVNASSFIEMYVGVGAKRVRELFQLARENAPCIIFIDEIDAIGTKRDEKDNHSEREQTINALLQEMDGFTDREGIFLIGATNRPDKLDKALVRSGRFDRQIEVHRPKNWMVRAELFRYYLRKLKVDETVQIESLSKQVAGFTGADIAMICNEAGIIATMQGKECIDLACMEEAIDKKILKGNRKKEKSLLEDRRIVAYHEAGHAIMTYLLHQKVSRISIIENTSGVGGAVFNIETESNFITAEELLNKVKIAYAGRIAEQLEFKSITTGAMNDIKQATQYLLAYIGEYGFAEQFGMLNLFVLQENNLVHKEQITTLLTKLSKELYEEATLTLQKHREWIVCLAEQLLEIETMNEEEFSLLMQQLKSQKDEM